MRRTNLESLVKYYRQNKNKQIYYKNHQSPKFSSLMKIFLILSIVFILVAGAILASILFFNRQSETIDNRLVELKMEGEKEVVSGQKYQFPIFLLNREASDLKSSELTVKFPDGFYLTSTSEPCTENLSQGCVWSLGKIRKDERKTIEIEGEFFKPSKNELDLKTFELLFNFELANFTSNFRKEVKKQVIVKSTLLTTFSPPDNLKIGQKDNWQVSIRNIGDNLIRDIKVIIEAPEELLINFPQVDNDKIKILSSRERGWLINELASQQKQDLVFEGYFLKSVNNPIIKIITGLERVDNQFFIQNVVNQEIIIGSEDISLSLETTNNQSIFSWAEKISLNLNYQNFSSSEFENTIIDVQISPSEYFDWLETKQSNWQWTDGQNYIEANTWQIESVSGLKKISFSKIQIPDLDSIKPQGQGKINLDLNLIKRNEALQNKFVNPEIKIQAKIKGKFKSQSEFVEFMAKPMILKIKTDLELNAEARYYNDERVKIGTGPVPPQVGQETNYHIFWRLKNTCNEVSNVKVETQLPDFVNWMSAVQPSLGQISYNPSIRKVIWQIDNLPAFSGGSYSLLEADFRISITPTEDQVGQVLPLTGQIILMARDDFVGQNIYQERSFLDTNLNGDPIVSGKGEIHK